jgi:hypothetical protein
MSRERRRRSYEGRHVRLDHYLLKTPAWQSLNAVARVIYIEVKFRFNGSNNGRIPYSIREAADALVSASLLPPMHSRRSKSAAS